MFQKTYVMLLRQRNMLIQRCSSVNLLRFSHCQTQADLMAKGLPKKKPIPGVKQIILVASGKGGVGKSTISANLAVAMKKLEPQKEVALLDADVFGPSIPLMMNANDTPLINSQEQLVPLVNYGVKIMSLGNLIKENSAAVWRGLMVMSALNNLITNVDWNPVDYMVIDTPPGTGDVHLSLAQTIPIAGAVVVSTGQKASLQITRRGITMFEKLKIPVLGMVYNMSSVVCTNCKHTVPIFGDHVEEFSKNNGIEVLGNIPMDPSVAEGSDCGVPIVISHPDSVQSTEIFKVGDKVLQFLKSTSDASTSISTGTSATS